MANVLLLGECLGLENVLFAVFEFIETLACSEHKKLHKLVATVMNDLVHLLISYMQPTEQQVMRSCDVTRHRR